MRWRSIFSICGCDTKTARPGNAPLSVMSLTRHATSPAGRGKCKCVLRPKVCGKAKFFGASPYHPPDRVPRADTWLPLRGHEQRPRPADETGSCEWRSALVLQERQTAPEKGAKSRRRRPAKKRRMVDKCTVLRYNIYRTCTNRLRMETIRIPIWIRSEKR